MTDKMKHTPGPWELVRDEDANVVAQWHIQVGEVRIPVFPYRRIYSEDRTQSGLVTDYEQMANARLIAAAPELLEALVEVRDWLLTPGDGCLSDAALGRIVEAIAKATGANNAP